MRVRIARIKKEHIPEIGLKGVVDAIIFKHNGKYWVFYSYGKRLSQKGKRFSSRRWIFRNNISISILRNGYQILSTSLYKIEIENIEQKDLVTIFSHYHKYLECCGTNFNIHLVEDFDAVLPA